MTSETEFDKDLSSFQRRATRTGYEMAVADVEQILKDSLAATSTPEECVLIIKIQTALHSMESVRFPNQNQQN